MELETEAGRIMSCRRAKVEGRFISIFISLSSLLNDLAAGSHKETEHSRILCCHQI